MDFKNLKKYLIPALVVFIVITVFNMIFHGILMEKLYAQNSHFFRPHDQIEKHKYFMWIANLIYSTAFCYVYSKGHEKKSDLVQGARFGIWISLLIWIPNAIISYTVYPFPKALQLAWLLGYTVQSVISGITASMVFSKRTK